MTSTDPTYLQKDPSQQPPNLPGSMGIPDTQAGATFELEEEQAAAARGQTYASLWAGFKLPASMGGDFWNLYSQAETFAANVGWRYLPTPKQLLTLMNEGMATANSLTVFQTLAKITGVNVTKMPWAPLGMSATTYAQTSANVGDSLFALTGQSDFTKAGLAGVQQTALFQNWSQAQLQQYIQQNATLNSKYGYLQYGYDYSTYQNYKVSNASALKERYGAKFTDAQAIQNLGDPLQSFHAEGGVFGESVPYVAASSQLPTGRQSSVR
jgi:hypothetical protein